MSNNDRLTLRHQLKAGKLIIAPGVYDLISALSADRLGFDAIYMTGYGVVASYLGLPDAGLASYSDMKNRVETIVGRTKTPLIADADTGFGGLLNVDLAVRGYEMAGAAAIQIEDQEFPKKCGHTPGRKVVPLEDMVQKIKVARDARDSKDFLIVARTDARTAHGLDEALRRAEAFATAGADVLFVESPESEEEMEKICSSFDLPCLAKLLEIGYQIAIFPATGFLGAAAAFDKIYGTLKTEGSSIESQVPLFPFDEMNKLMGFERVWEFDKKHSRD